MRRVISIIKREEFFTVAAVKIIRIYRMIFPVGKSPRKNGWRLTKSRLSFPPPPRIFDRNRSDGLRDWFSNRWQLPVNLLSRYRGHERLIKAA